MRTWAGWYAAARTRTWTSGAPRPLLLVLDCKGGPDARVKAARTRRLLHAVGAARVAVWPDEATVSLWGAAAPRPRRDLVPDDRDRHRGRRLLRRHHPGRAHPRRHRTHPGRPPTGRSSWPGWTRPGWKPPTATTRPAGRCPRRPPPAPRHQPALPDPAVPPRPRPGRPGERWRTRTPGISSWKAPASRPSPKRRPWP